MLVSIRNIASSSKTILSPIRAFSSTLPSLSSSSRASFSKPGPPPLPKEDQAEFEALLKANQSIGASPAVTAPPEDVLEHPDIRRGPKKDFEGEVNPKTGERGGPKTDPFKAGPNDWQYGGRVTDF